MDDTNIVATYFSNNPLPFGLFLAAYIIFRIKILQEGLP